MESLESMRKNITSGHLERLLDFLHSSDNATTSCHTGKAHQLWHLIELWDSTSIGSKWIAEPDRKKETIYTVEISNITDHGYMLGVEPEKVTTGQIRQMKTALEIDADSANTRSGHVRVSRCIYDRAPKGKITRKALYNVIDAESFVRTVKYIHSAENRNADAEKIWHINDIRSYSRDLIRSYCKEKDWRDLYWVEITTAGCSDHLDKKFSEATFQEWERLNEVVWGF